MQANKILFHCVVYKMSGVLTLPNWIKAKRTYPASKIHKRELRYNGNLYISSSPVEKVHSWIACRPKQQANNVLAHIFLLRSLPAANIGHVPKAIV